MTGISDIQPGQLDTSQALRLHDWSRRIGDLLIWSVYEMPRDFPGHYVARPHSVRMQQPLAVHLQHLDLEGLRLQLPRGLTRINRHADDDPAIIEIWL